jgi:hypothetical protein
MVREIGGEICAEVPGKVGFRYDGSLMVAQSIGDRVFLIGRDDDSGKPKVVEVASLRALAAGLPS